MTSGSSHAAVPTNQIRNRPRFQFISWHR
jgi:hypothetical protein